MTPSALLFDLDNTLVLEDEVTMRAVRAACGRAAGRTDVERLVSATVRVAEERWRAAPTFSYAEAMGMWWGEGLWGEFRGNGDGLRRVREFAPRFRREVWRDALAACGVDDESLAAQLAGTFRTARRAGEIVDPDAAPVLADLARDHRMALVTNGAPDVQREKLGRTPLARYFKAIVISAELDIGKPEPGIFEAALKALDAVAEDAVMIGDSLPRDVAGARRAGLRSIWVDRDGTPARTDDPVPDARVRALSEIRAALDAMAPAGASPRDSP